MSLVATGPFVNQAEIRLLEGVVVSPHKNDLLTGEDRQEAFIAALVDATAAPTVTFLQLNDNVWTQVFSIGPASVTVTFDISTLTGTVILAILGKNVATATLSKDHPVHLKVGNFIAGASLDLELRSDNSLWLTVEAHAFSKKFSYGPKQIFKI